MHGEFMGHTPIIDKLVKLRIQPLMSVKSYNDPSNILLTDFSTPGEFSKEANVEVSGEFIPSDETPRRANTSINFSAHSSGDSQIEGSWIKMEKIFDPLINLSDNQALGVWIKGDGNGQLLNFRIGNPKPIGYAGVRGDHFVDVDFTGCVIGPVKALPILPITISNPSITIGGKTIVLPVTMESGIYIEFKSQLDWLKNLSYLDGEWIGF